MFSISVERTFAASHQLRLSDGSKEPQHSHDWTVVVSVDADKLDETGVVMDFRRLQTILDNIIEEFENTKLEQLDCFMHNNASAENIAKYIYDRIAERLPNDVNPDYVRVTESPGCTAQYRLALCSANIVRKIRRLFI